jgi:hypothetical protein
MCESAFGNQLDGSIISVRLSRGVTHLSSPLDNIHIGPLAHSIAFSFSEIRRPGRAVCMVLYFHFPICLHEVDNFPFTSLKQSPRILSRSSFSCRLKSLTVWQVIWRENVSPTANVKQSGYAVPCYVACSPDKPYLNFGNLSCIWCQIK